MTRAGTPGEGHGGARVPGLGPAYGRHAGGPKSRAPGRARLRQATAAARAAILSAATLLNPHGTHIPFRWPPYLSLAHLRAGNLAHSRRPHATAGAFFGHARHGHARALLLDTLARHRSLGPVRSLVYFSLELASPFGKAHS